jgi:hypothetical protein
MKNKTSLIVALSSLLACALFAAPAKINYQGLITDTAGEPIESGTNTVTVTLYQVETDGTSIYTESFIDVTSDADGIYSIQIGDTNLQAVLEANSELWLELVINGQTLSPRQEINSVPYALVADSANRLINASDSSISGDLSVSGNSIFSGNSTFSGNSYFGNDIDVSGRVDAMDGRFHMLDVMGRVMASDIFVQGSLEMHGYRANFENASEVRVPTPDQPNEATNKAYVDSLVSTSIASDNAKGLVQLAVTENVSNLSEYYLTYESGGSTLNPAQGDLVLLTGQTTASENGIYEVSSVNLSSSYSSSSSSSGPTASDYYVSLTRASNFDSADEFVTGSFVFVEKGTEVGRGYVLGELASEFALGTSALSYIQFTVDTTSDVAFDQSVSASSLTTSGDLSVSGNSIFSGNSTFNGNSTFGNDIDVMGRVEAEDGRFFMLDVMGYVMASDIFVQGSLEMHGYRANFENASEVRVPTPDQPNEATNKAYVDGVVVPPGGLIAWSSASPLPTGWSDAGLSSPMPNYIWIIKN